MRKVTALIFFVLVISCSNGYAQDKEKIGEDRSKAKVRMEELLLKAERNIKNPDRLNDALYEYMQYPAKPHLDAEERRAVSRRFIKIFQSIDDSLTNMANKGRILEVVGFSDNGPEAHEFFLKILSSDSEEYRKMALWGIRPLGVHGDDLYEKIKSLEKEGKVTKIRSLQCLTRANPARALEEMKTILKTTQSVKEFVLVGGNLPSGIGDTTEVLDVIVDRYEDLKNKQISTEDVGYSPDAAVLSKTLWEYIAAKEGVRVKVALEIIQAKGVCGRKDLAILARKTRSSNKTTREAAVDFLENQTISGNLKRDWVFPILKDAKNIETDPDLKRKLSKVIGNLEKARGI